MLLSRITLGDEIKTFLCGDIVLLVEVLNLKTFILYHYFQVLQGSVGEGGGGVRISRGWSLLTCPVHVLLHVPSAKLKKYWEGLQLGRGQQGHKGNNPSSCSLFIVLR